MKYRCLAVLLATYLALSACVAPTPVPTSTSTPEGSKSVTDVAYIGRAWKQNTDLSLPFDFVAYVGQAWNGRPTHYGRWRYAIDFLIVDQYGKSYRGAGDRVEDYYVWGERVLAPASGTVVAAVDSLPDNPPNHPDNRGRWGNHVIIYHGNGEYSEFSHLQYGSLVVEVGEKVVRGQPLALIGSSGFAYAPHLHFQVQNAPYVGASTLPARFSSYYQIVNGTVTQQLDSVPSEGDYVANLPPR